MNTVDFYSRGPTHLYFFFPEILIAVAVPMKLAHVLYSEFGKSPIGSRFKCFLPVGDIFCSLWLVLKTDRHVGHRDIDVWRLGNHGNMFSQLPLLYSV